MAGIIEVSSAGRNFTYEYIIRHALLHYAGSVSRLILRYSNSDTIYNGLTQVVFS